MNLVEKMTEWANLRKQLDKLEAELTTEIIPLGRTQEIDLMVATYRKSSTNGKYDYPGMAKEIQPSQEIVEKFTKTEVKVDWKKIVEECGVSDEVKQAHYAPPVEGVPTVSFSLK